MHFQRSLCVHCMMSAVCWFNFKPSTVGCCCYVCKRYRQSDDVNFFLSRRHYHMHTSCTIKHCTSVNVNPPDDYSGSRIRRV